jgi:hypothetical protein
MNRSRLWSLFNTTPHEICPPKKLEILVKQGVNHPDIDEENLDEETLGRSTGWIHNNILQTTN